MGRIRTVKPEFWEDEEIGSLSRDARLLYIASWNLADDEGLLRWTPAYVKSSVFMYDGDLGIPEVTALMTQLAVAGKVVPYLGGRAQQRLAWVVNFRRHQKINRPQPGRLPPPGLQDADVQLAYQRRDKGICWVCGVATSGGWVPTAPLCDDSSHSNDDGYFRPALDRFIPRSQGGTDYPSNVRLAHIGCIRDSSGMSRPENTGDMLPAASGPSTQSGQDSLFGSLNGSLNDSVPDSLPDQGSGNREQGSGNSAYAPAAKPRANVDDQRARTLAGFWYETTGKLANWAAAYQILRKAVKAGKWDDDQLKAALQRLVDENRALTVETLRISLNGTRPARGSPQDESDFLIQLERRAARGAQPDDG